MSVRLSYVVNVKLGLASGRRKNAMRISYQNRKDNRNAILKKLSEMAAREKWN